MSKMISTAFKYFFSGYSQYTVFTTKKQAKEYLKNNSIIHRIKDLQKMTIRDWETISAHPRNQVFEIIDNVAVPMEIEIIDPVENSEKIWWSHEQEKYISLDDAIHYADMKEFFDSQLSNLQIQAHMPFCSRCGKNDPDYIGFIQGAIVSTSFSFCVDCRNELTLKKNAAIAAQERIGA